MTVEDIINFIEEYTPTFQHGADCKLSMFTIPTQWIKGSGAKELIERGINCAKRQNGKSPFSFAVEATEDELARERESR